MTKEKLVKIAPFYWHLFFYNKPIWPQGYDLHYSFPEDFIQEKLLVFWGEA